MSIVATARVERIDITFAYARMSEMESWAIVALVIGRKSWRIVIAAGEGQETRIGGYGGGGGDGTRRRGVSNETSQIQAMVLQINDRPCDRPWPQDCIVFPDPRI